MIIRYLGHSSFHITIGNTKIIVDPYITPNPLAAHIDIKSLTADYILLTHGHGDHIADVEAIAAQTGASIVSTYEVVTYFENKGIKGHPMNIGGSWNFDFGRLKLTNAIHTSSFPDGSYAGNPCGFMLYTDEENLYIAGDTALTMDMKLIPMFGPKPDIAILPIGSNFTMDADDAVIASDFIECDKIIGCHYDTFGYIKIDQEETINKFKSKGKELILLPIGKSFTY